jgi:GTP cyclohydrolase I
MTPEKRIELAERAYTEFMEVLGIPIDYNSKETANRVAKMMVNEKCYALYNQPPNLKAFPNDKKYDEYIVVKDIPYYSVCAHHHVPFFGRVHVAYHPNKQIVGLSKFSRVVSFFASKPQIQEEMTEEIAQYLNSKIEPKGLAIRVYGSHMCMESRGAKAIGSMTLTQKFMGEIDKREVEGLFDENFRDRH